MDFSVIVPAFNAQATLSACLHALARQTMAADRYEVVVVDDGSSDGTAALARAAGVRVFSQTNQGQAGARNRGVAEARGDIVVFTDADCEPAPDWLQTMVAPFADPDVAGCKGVYRTRQRQLAARFAQIEYEERYARMSSLERIDFVDTYSAAYRRQVFVDNEGFDVSFPGDSSGEDQEFSFRLSERGHKLVFVPQAVVYHQHPASVVAYWRRKYKTGYWKALVLRLHPEKAVRDTHTPPSLKAQMGLLALTPPAIAAGALAGHVWPAVGGVALLLIVSMARFTLVAFGKDRAVGLIAPSMLVVRALALGLGLARGLWHAASGRGPLLAQRPKPAGQD